MTVRGKLFPTGDQAHKLDELMRIQSSAMRYSYSRLCEGKSKSESESGLKEKIGKSARGAKEGLRNTGAGESESTAQR